MSKSLVFNNLEKLKNAYLWDIGHLFELEARRANKEVDGRDNSYITEGPKEMQGYKCIHLPTHEFFNTLNEVIKKTKLNEKLEEIKFLDVGCGVGQKVFLAEKLFGMYAHGIELRKPIAEAAKKITYSYRETKIFEETALTFKDYDKYDIIYFYQPIADFELSKKMELLIAEKAKSGCIVIGFGARMFRPGQEKINKLGWKPLFNKKERDLTFFRYLCWQKQ